MQNLMNIKMEPQYQSKNSIYISMHDGNYKIMSGIPKKVYIVCIIGNTKITYLSPI